MKQLAEAIKNPPHGWTSESLWTAYAIAEADKVRGVGKRTAADLVSLVRFALEEEPILAPFSEAVNARFGVWRAAQEAAGVVFSPEQVQWLEMIRDHVSASLTVAPEHFDYVPFSEHGGLGRAYTLFGERLNPLLAELSEVLVA